MTGKAARAARWSLLNTVVARLGNLATGILLARLLTPADYGAYAVALTVLTVLLSMNELGVSLAIIRWDDDIADFAPTVMTVGLASSCALYAGLFMAAPHLAGLVNVPGATNLIRLLCISVVLDGVSTVPAAVLTREFAGVRRFAIDFASLVAGSTTTVVLARAGHGAMSFGWGRTVGGLIALVLVTRLCPVRIRPGWKRQHLRPLLRFGLPAAGSSLIVLALLDIDYLIVGHTLGPQQLGYYLLAFNMSGWSVSLFGEAARRVSFAGFSRLAGRENGIGDAVSWATRALLLLTAPVCALLFGYAEPLIRLLYGNRWGPAAPALRILAILGLLRVVYFLGYDALVALGRSRTLIRLQLMWLALLVPALVIGGRLAGLPGVALAHVLLLLFVVLPRLLGALRQHGLEPRRVLAGVTLPAIGAVAIALAAQPVVDRVEGDVMPILVGGLLSALLYSPALWWGRHLLRGTDLDALQDKELHHGVSRRGHRRPYGELRRA